MASTVEIANILNQPLKVVQAKLAEMGEFVPSVDTELSGTVRRKLLDALSVDPLDERWKRDEGSETRRPGKGLGKGEGKAPGDPTDPGEGEPLEGEGPGQGEEGEELESSMLEEFELEELEGEGTEPTEGQGEADGSEDGDGEPEEEPTAEEEESGEGDGLPRIYLSEDATVQDLADELNTSVVNIYVMAEFVGIDTEVDLEEFTEWIAKDHVETFMAIAATLGYEIHDPDEEPPLDEKFYIPIGVTVKDTEFVEFKENTRIRIGDAIAVNMAQARIDGLRDAQGTVANVIVSGKAQVFGWLGEPVDRNFGSLERVLRAPNDRLARRLAKSE